MPVVILSALKAEIELLVNSLEGASKTEVGGWPIWVGSIAGRDLVLGRAGLGKVNTAALTAVLWDRYRPDLFIFTGVAGGLDPALGIGDIVIGEDSIQHDWGVVASDGLRPYQAGHVPFFNPTDEFGYVPSQKILRLMRSVASAVDLKPVLGRAPTITFGRIVTGDQFIQDTHTRDRLHLEFGARAVEMEGAALGQVASRFGVDHLLIRALSDLASGESPRHFDRFVSQVASNSALLVRALIARL